MSRKHTVIVGPNLAAPGPIGGTTPSTGAFTSLKIGTTTDPIESEALTSVLVCRTITGTTAGRGFRDSTVTSATGGHNSFDAYPSVNTASTTVDHVADFQARGLISGVAGTLTNWYGVWSKLEVSAGATVDSLRNYFVANRIGAGTVNVQYALVTEDLTSATHNYYLACAGSGTAATQTKQSSFHHPKIHFGANTNGSDNYQVEITPLAGNVLGRTALSISGGVKTGANLPTINIAETWNNASNAYAMIYGRITNTASHANSMIIDVGTVASGSLFQVKANGDIVMPGGGQTVVGTCTARSGTATTAGGSAQAFGMGTVGIGFSFGSGAPSTSRPKGSVYLRTDGSTTNDRLYVATDSAGTWTAVTTAA